MGHVFEFRLLRSKENLIHIYVYTNNIIDITNPL